MRVIYCTISVSEHASDEVLEMYRERARGPRPARLNILQRSQVIIIVITSIKLFKLI